LAYGTNSFARNSASTFPLDFITWCVTLGGPEIGRLDLRPLDATGRKGPEPWTNCPQNVLEPILVRNASERPETRAVLGAECCEVEQRDDGVVAHVRLEGGAGRRIAAESRSALDQPETSAAQSVCANSPGASTRSYVWLPK
jgi:2-polyprenyl-6-methoxyphenol hydroxylase-like FAD-dependent oxidoreductase